MAPLKWWQTAVFYQIYPRSFADGNGDGIGDFKGIISKLDYLQRLGIDGIWLSPHFPSPQWDCGYDVADYTDVEPDYGTLDEFKVFLHEAHQRNIRVILDLVLNHTSDEHRWFKESRSSRDNPKRDWYIWRDPCSDGTPPNNWYSTFGGSAWEYDETTDSYYYHFFFKQQPDLNWRNPEVKQAMFDAVRFWLDLGVDGFRLDAIGTIFEEEDLPDQTCELSQDELMRMSHEAKTPEEFARLQTYWDKMYIYQHDLPGVHELMRELRALLDTYEDRVLVGETDEIAFYGSGDDELHLVFNFPLMRAERLSPEGVRENQKTRLSSIPSIAWPCNALGNHDSPRVYNRFGDGEHNDALARQNLLLLLTLKGTPFLYNGEEIGMSDYRLTDFAQVRDILGLWFYRLAKELGGVSDEEALEIALMNSRDRNRTPMQWRNAPNGGFSPAGVSPWLPVNPNYAQGINVADQEEEDASMLNYYRQALRLRRENPALAYGEYQALEEDNPNVLAFVRTTSEQRLLMLFNMTAERCTVEMKLPVKHANWAFSTHPHDETEVDLASLSLAPFESAVIQVNE